ncbi:G-utrophin-like [Tropilaelaps mercedesae]|uniref:G-utrophin-like n=1 Tax=Tropilaelaps mercedesae TaxID=418985 RepID=A0A1V9XR16_9ACAR|nr:G-utrophin-like [Tropilaelaps mercedesae]
MTHDRTLTRFTSFRSPEVIAKIARNEVSFLRTKKMQALQRALDELGSRLHTAETAKQNWPSGVCDLSMDQLAQQIDDLKPYERPWSLSL